MNDPTLDVISRRLTEIEGAVTKLRLDVVATDAGRIPRREVAVASDGYVAAHEPAEAPEPAAVADPAAAPAAERSTQRTAGWPSRTAGAVVAPARFPASALPAPGSTHLFERIVSGRGMAVTGLLLILFGCAYFLELSFTRNWIGPSERIALGLIAGTFILAASTRFLNGAYRMLAEGTVAFGAALLYVSTWAAVVVFPDLHVPHLAACGAMITITSVLALIANRARSQPIAVMGLAGAYLTPLFGGYVFDLTALAAYLFIVTGGMLALARCRSFVVVENMTIAATLLYAFKFAPDTSAHWSAAAAATVASLFFTIFAVAFTTRPLRDGRAKLLSVVPFIVTCAAYISSLEYIFYAQPTLLAAMLGSVALLLLGAPFYRNFPAELKASYRALGILAFNLALHEVFHKTELFDALSIEGAVLVLLGGRAHNANVTRIGMAFLAVPAIGLVYEAITLPPTQSAFTPLALGFIVWLRSAFSARRAIPQNVKTACSLVVHAVAFAGLTRIALDTTGGAHWNVALTNLAQCTLSLVWALFAATLFALGVTSRDRLQRYEGLALFGVTILKVTTIDLAYLDLAYRIIAFIGIGILLFVSSAWYTRSLKTQPVESAA